MIFPTSFLAFTLLTTVWGGNLLPAPNEGRWTTVFPTRSILIIQARKQPHMAMVQAGGGPHMLDCLLNAYARRVSYYVRVLHRPRWTRSASDCITSGFTAGDDGETTTSWWDRCPIVSAVLLRISNTSRHWRDIRVYSPGLSKNKNERHFLPNDRYISLWHGGRRAKP
jgi:hypothetical protein